MGTEVVFTRAGSGAETVERLIRESRRTIDAALYRFTNERLAAALLEAARRDVRVRLVLDLGKHKESELMEGFLAESRLAVRLVGGRKGRESKMHHKFAIFDAAAVALGSYNWTRESEEANYENLVVLRDEGKAAGFAKEFEALWNEAWEAPRPGPTGSGPRSNTKSQK